jgi:hypothetical protein
MRTIVNNNGEDAIERYDYVDFIRGIVIDVATRNL